MPAPFSLEDNPWYDELLEKYPPNSPEAKSGAQEGVAVFHSIYQGTTGQSGAAMLTHYNLLANVTQIREWPREGLILLKKVGRITGWGSYPFFIMTCVMNTGLVLPATASRICNSGGRSWRGRSGKKVNKASRGTRTVPVVPGGLLFLGRGKTYERLGRVRKLEGENNRPGGEDGYQQRQLQRRLIVRLARLSGDLEKFNLAGYMNLLNNPRRYLLLNFLGGLSRGLGFGLGATLLAALLIYILQRLVFLNLPLIGDFIAELVKIVNKQMKG